MTRENLNSYKGQENVTKITSDEGSVSYLTQSVSFCDEAYRVGATALNTVETEKKHVLFLFNSEGSEAGRYYLGKKLQGKSPAEIAEQKHLLIVFKSFNPQSESWVPCIGLSSQPDLASSAVTF